MISNIRRETSVEKGKKKEGKQKSELRYFYSEQGNCHLRSHRKISPKMKPNKLCQQDVIATILFLTALPVASKGEEYPMLIFEA